jgi:NAD(P)-dependent dehydrogenase (short-subunit alcohol dehydrogenase family)
VVTGGARGIGEAIVLRLASEGAHVVIVDMPKVCVAGCAVTTVHALPFDHRPRRPSQTLQERSEDQHSPVTSLTLGFRVP